MRHFSRVCLAPSAAGTSWEAANPGDRDWARGHGLSASLRPQATSCASGISFPTCQTLGWAGWEIFQMFVVTEPRAQQKPNLVRTELLSRSGNGGPDPPGSLHCSSPKYFPLRGTQ